MWLFCVLAKLSMALMDDRCRHQVRLDKSALIQQALRIQVLVEDPLDQENLHYGFVDR